MLQIKDVFYFGMVLILMFLPNAVVHYVPYSTMNDGTDWITISGNEWLNAITSSNIINTLEKRSYYMLKSREEHFSAIPAFPEAEGYGAGAFQNCDRSKFKVIEVTNLNDDGPGSLRDAIETAVPRIVVFRVGGLIELENRIELRYGCIYVAGQTAPGGGISVKSSIAANGRMMHISTEAHDVVIRYLRLRSGNYGSPGTGQVNILISDGYDIIIDHTSLSWTLDENIAFWSFGKEVNNITLQRSIIAEGLAPHSTGLLVGGTKDYSDPNNLIEEWRQVRNITIHHNLFIHNSHRNPRVTSAGVKVINNVVYNWKARIGGTVSGTFIDYIKNFYKKGPASTPNGLLRHESFPLDYPEQQFPDPSIYLVGNVALPDHPDQNANNWELENPALILDHFVGTIPPENFRRDVPLPQAPIPVTIESTYDAYNSVVADVGANMRLDCLGNWVPNSDTVDLRLLADVENDTGPDEPISDPNEVGGYPAIKSGTPCIDSDHDGMPNAWENNKGFNPNDATDGPKDADYDRYTNIEEYLNGTDPKTPDYFFVLLPTILVNDRR